MAGPAVNFAYTKNRIVTLRRLLRYQISTFAPKESGVCYNQTRILSQGPTRGVN